MKSLPLLLPVISLCVLAQPSSEKIAAVRSDLSQIYSYLDSAFEDKRFDDALRVVLPDATVIHGGTKVPFATMIQQMKQVLATGGSVKQKTAITSVEVLGPEVRITRSTDATLTINGQTRSGVERSVDTWVRSRDGWRLKMSAVLGSGEVAASTAAETANKVVQDLNRYAQPLDDLTPIANAIGDARVVALGEATHGTHEFSATKARVVEYLVAQKGFTVLAVEGNWPEALAIDRYIKSGDGDPKEALASLKNYPLLTREMLTLMDAMRSINVKTPGRLTFTGFDMQWPDAARERVVDFIRRTAPEQLAVVMDSYKQVLDLGPRRPAPDAGARPAAEAARRVVELFDRLKDVLISASGRAEWRDARQAAEIVHQATAYRIEGQSFGYRDEMMARNARWLINEAHPEEKVIVWAHNGHVTSDPKATVKPMGAWLRENLGEKFYSIGFSVAGGEVRAVGSKGLATQVMPSAREGTGDAVFARISLPAFFLDIRGVPDTTGLKKWLIEPHAFYTVGARWNDVMIEANTSVYSMARSFDGLVFFREGHASTQP